MQKRQTIAANPSPGSKFREGRAAPNLYDAHHQARLEALRRAVELREQAWKMSQLLAARIFELLGVPAVKTISRPGCEPQVVFLNSGADTALPPLMQRYVLLTKLAEAPLPAESALTAGLAESLGVRVGGEANEAAPKPVLEATAPDSSRATKCNVLQRNGARMDEKAGIQKCA